MQGIKLKSYELMLLLQFYFHSMNTITYARNMQATNHPEIYAFWDGKNKLRQYFKDNNKYEKTFNKLVNLGFIKDWGTFQHLTYKSIEYIKKL